MQKTEELPFIYTIGPMLTMGMTSMVTVVSTISNLHSSGKSWTSAIPTIVISVAMLASILLWPNLTKMYNKRLKKKKEEQRRVKYTEYLESKKKCKQKSQ